MIWRSTRQRQRLWRTPRKFVTLSGCDRSGVQHDVERMATFHPQPTGERRISSIYVSPKRPRLKNIDVVGFKPCDEGHLSGPVPGGVHAAERPECTAKTQ